MSQQINLLLPALRPRFDWLSLPVVLGVALLGLLLLAILGGMGGMQLERLRGAEADIKEQVQAAQLQIQTLGQKLTARQGDSSLDQHITLARQAVTQRQEVLSVIARGDVTRANAYSGLLQGFSRQIVNGVWLQGFTFTEQDIEMRGRLIDPALLPTYISKLNGEPAFTGRRFSALDMKGVDPTGEKLNEATEGNKPKIPVRYTEFVLRTELLANVEAKR